MRWRRFAQLSIKRKQMVILMATSAAALLLASGGFIVYELLIFEHDAKASLHDLAVDIGRDSASAIIFNNPEAANLVFERFLLLHPEVTGAAVYTTNAEIFAHYPAAFRAPPAPDLPEDVPQSSALRLRGNRLEMFVRVVAGGEGGERISVPVYLRSNLDLLYERLRRYAVILAVVFIGSLVPLWFLSFRLQHLLTAPILDLLQTVRAFSETKNYAVRATRAGADELGALVDGFNTMLAQIQERDGALQKVHNELEKRVEQRTLALRQEIAERLRAEEAVRESDERFKLVARATNDAVWDWNLSTNALWWNEGFQSLFGYSHAPAEATVQSWLSRLHPDDSRRVVTRKNKAVSSGENFWSDEYRFRRADGSYAYIFDRGYVIRDEQGKPLRMVGAMADITARKESESALRQNLARITLLNVITHAISERQELSSISRVTLEQLATHLPADFGAILLYDAKEDVLNVASAHFPSGGLGLPDLAAGARFEASALGLGSRLAGPPAQVTTETCPELLAPLAAGGFAHRIATPLLEQGNPVGLLVCARRNEPFAPGECELLVTLGDQLALAIHQAALYTQLQNAYNELRRTQQSVIEQERLRALGKMASGIAHDINNALSPIVVYSELLLRQDRTQNTETSERFLNSIKTAGEDIAHIVSRMREFYRRREDNEPVYACNLNELAQQVIDLTRPRWRDIPLEHGLVVEVRTGFEASLSDITGNASELREAITNLVLNAVDAMPAGGKIWLRTLTQRWQAAEGGGRVPTHVSVEVQDTGMGMDEETRSRCLEPFFTTKGKRGTGLGLAMVYGVAERHEAHIDIESAPGRGATVRLTFPVRRPGASAAGQPELQPAGIVSLHILCIDDEPLIRQLLKETLELDGHRVEIADGGESGVAAFEAARGREPFDVVITDLGMPRVDGRQLAVLLKKESPATPVIMLTGWGTMMKADGDVPANVDCVLSKPPRVNELRQAIRHVTQKSS